MLYGKADEKLPVGLDCDHYKMMTVQKPPLDSRQSFLDALCFPVLFLSGRYGQYYPREVKLDFSKYVKCHLLNKDLVFAQNPEYVFYYLWLKELRELSSGIYNTLKRSRQGSEGVTAQGFVEGVQSSDEKVEVNLQTMFQSIRGSKQFWFFKAIQSALQIWLSFPFSYVKLH